MKTVVTVTIDIDLFRRIEDLQKRLGRSRSWVMQRVLKEGIKVFEQKVKDVELV